MKWDTTGISVFFFPRDAIPADVAQDTPVPSTWGLPMANFPSTTCDPFTFFKDNFAIFDTTFCGDWAGESLRPSLLLNHGTDMAFIKATSGTTTLPTPASPNRARPRRATRRAPTMS